MNRQEINILVKQMNVDTAIGKVDHRIQTIIVRLLGDLFQPIEDLNIQLSELWKGLEYFMDARQANELGILTAGLGLHSFFDKSQSDFNLRRTILTGADGKYVAQTTMPVAYDYLPNGTTQFVIDKLGCHGKRPSHVHHLKLVAVKLWLKSL